MPCKLCGNTTNNTPYHVREMMLGTRDAFDYFQCGECECLQIETIPHDMNKYYPQTYYSFNELEEHVSRSFVGKIKNYGIRLRDLYAITNKGILGKILYSLRPFTELRGLSVCDITTASSILDVGCGTGHYLYKLKTYGFDNVHGVDPFLQKSITYTNGLTIQKGDLHDVQGLWDIIMLHHSLEHMEHQKETLFEIASHLKASGKCLIRIPTVTSDPWEHYREHWVHLDPPRHFFLHSHTSITNLAHNAGLEVVSISSDANAFSFYGSEYYLRDIPASEWKESVFSKRERAIFAQEARNINARNRGDTIVVILQKKHI